MRKTEVTVGYLMDVLQMIDDGCKLTLNGKYVEYELNDSVTLLIAHLIEGFLYRHKYTGDTDGECRMD